MATEPTNIPNGENAATGTPKVQAADVGWQFVPQYYTFVNTAPQRLHCFYNKKSTFIHGAEGEDVKPCFGQTEIHQKILSLNFSDCKVYIHSIDSQSSYGGGIIIQVIGEMSNANGPWRKFTQTFFLAEQPNGYFVLNDIFRYLKEEGEEDEELEDEVIEDEAVAPQEQAQTYEAPEEVPVAEEAAAEEPEVTTPLAETTPALPEIEEPQVEEEPVVEQKPAVTAPEPAVEEPAPTVVVAPTLVETAPAPEAVATPPSVPAAEKAVSPAPAPAAAPAPVQKPPAPPAQPSKPAGPKTWASLAASKGAWGGAASSPVQGVSSAPAPATAPAVSAAPRVPVNAQTNGHHNGPSGQQRGPARSSHYEAAQNVQTPICFVKLGNWQNPEGSDSVDEQLLRAALSRFGEISKVEIVKGKACAFVDFKSVESARKAITASLQARDGGEGGIKLGDGNKVQVEARKEKEERPKGFGQGQRKAGGPGGPPQQQGQGPQGQGGESGFVQRQGRAKGGRGKGPGGPAVGGAEKPPQK